MKILYHQTIDSDKTLKSFVRRQEPEYRRDVGIFISRLTYDLEGLTRELTHTIETTLRSTGHTVVPTADDKLWISAPEKFALYIQSNIPRQDIYIYSNKDIRELLTKDMIKTKNTLPAGIFRRQKPVYNEKPKVIVQGTIIYEQITGVEPTPIIEILKKLGYQSEVIPISKELEQIYEKITNTVKGTRTLLEQPIITPPETDPSDEETSLEEEIASISPECNNPIIDEGLNALTDEALEDDGEWGELSDLLGDIGQEPINDDITEGALFHSVAGEHEYEGDEEELEDSEHSINHPSKKPIRDPLSSIFDDDTQDEDPLRGLFK